MKFGQSLFFFSFDLKGFRAMRKHTFQNEKRLWKRMSESYPLKKCRNELCRLEKKVFLFFMLNTELL